MIKIKKSIRIDAPVSRVFDFASNPENMPAFWPSMVEVTDVKRGADGGYAFDWVYKMAGVRFRGHSDPLAHEKDSLVVTRSKKGIPSTFRWHFQAEKGGTLLNLEVDYELPGKLLDKLAEPIVKRINEREADTVLANIKEMVETGKRARGRPEARA